MTYKDLVKKLQAEMNALGSKLTVDGDPGAKTQAEVEKYDVELKLTKAAQSEPLPGMHLHPIDWLRNEKSTLAGVKEVPGNKDNPRIVQYHKHSGNIGGEKATHHDEVPWCSSVLNCAADECGMEKTNSALASSWDKYGEDSGDTVEEGDIVTIRHTGGGRHVCLANKTFSRRAGGSFEALGGNQGNQIKVSTFPVAHIIGARKWKAKGGTKTAPIGSKPGDIEADGSSESTR